MTLLKKLLLFGGVPAAGASAAAVAVPFVLKQQKNEGGEAQVENLEKFDENEKVEEIDISGIETTTNKKDEQIKILKKAGLFCGNSPKDGNVCRLYSGGFRLKNGSNVEEGLKFSASPKGKLVLRKSNPYSYGLRLSVEGADIELQGATGKSPQKLERFESYGIEAEEGQGTGKKLYLVKKETHQEGVMRALGLPTNCQLPLDGTTKECSLSSEQIKSVHFDGRKKEGATIADSQNTTLKISKSVDTNLFKESYRFAFSSPAEITIKEGDVIKTNASTEFTVKEWKDENMVLVRAGSGEKEGEFFSKVGLKCTGDAGNETCTIEKGKLNVIKGDSSNENNKLTDGNKTGGNGIIKLHRNQANYVNGLKFSIEGEDILISDTTANSKVNRLSVFDGYEITETGGKFYLKRKDVGLDLIIKKLGISENPTREVEDPKEPVFNSTVSNSPNKIKFYVENQSANITENKAIEVNGYRSTDTTNYKYGYRFTLKPTGGDVNIGSIKLKENVTYDFKIREESGKLYLERTIDPTKIKELLGLNCTSGDSTETCTFKAGKANVRHWGEGRNIKNATVESQAETVKLKLTKDQAGFTDGFMFTVEGGDITFTGVTSGGEKIRMAEFEKYEIQLKDGVWYLYQKKNFMQVKHNDLGIDQACNNEFYSYCELKETNAAEKLKFKVKNGKSTKVQFSNNAKVLIKLKKDPQITTGIKVSMKVEGGELSVVCNSENNKILLKLTKEEEEEFKIEKIDKSFYLTKITGESNETCTAPAAK